MMYVCPLLLSESASTVGVGLICSVSLQVNN